MNNFFFFGFSEYEQFGLLQNTNRSRRKFMKILNVRLKICTSCYLTKIKLFY